MLEGILHRGRPGEGIGEITLRALGPVAGRVLLGVYALWFLLYSAFALRIGAERFIETVFPLSRPWPFVVTILAMAVCGALGRTKALFRASEIFLPLLMLVLVLVLVFAAPGLNVKNLLPATVQELPRRCAQRADGVRHRGGGAVFRRVHWRAHPARARAGTRGRVVVRAHLRARDAAERVHDRHSRRGADGQAQPPVFSPCCAT